MATSFMSSKPTSGSGSTFDQDHDANSALTELDKALRSGQIGLQCEAVIKFPRLFEKYPFPILINSAMLKIADVFRVGNNFIRLCILRVAQQSEKHLDKIFSVDDFTRRIFGVIHSNDPIARAVTLRILGSMASIIAEKKTVHHSILQYLDSHNSTEVEAAIFAAEKFCKTSKNFAAEVCSAIGSMIGRLETPAEMKLQLIPILQHMHHDAQMTEKALTLCQSVIDTYAAHGFVTVAINTMTQVTLQSLIGIQSHVDRLLNILNSDPRKLVKAVCLDDLKLLAEKSAYLWTQKNLNDVTKFSLETPLLMLKIKAVCVLNAAFNDVAVNHQHLQSDSPILDVCLAYCYHPCGKLSSQATHLLTQLAKHKSMKGDGSDLTVEAIGIIQAQLVLLSGHQDKSTRGVLSQLKLVLKCAVEICWHEPEASSKLVPTLISLLAVTTDSSQLSICECLAAIGSHSPGAIDAITPSILANLSAAISNGNKEIGQIQVHLCTLLFQARCHDKMSGLISGQVMSCIEEASPWIAYKVARQAMRYCQYRTAYDILHSIHHESVTEYSGNWLLGLQNACGAEKTLKESTKSNDNMMAHLETAIHFYTKSQVAFKASMNPSNSQDFACRYVKMRMSILQAHHMLLLTCISFSAKPPPVVIATQSSNSGFEGTKWIQIVQQLEKCLKAYKDASNLTLSLYRSSFDADSTSLQNISVFQQCCDCMKSVISTIISAIHTGQSNLGERQFLIKKNRESQPGSLWNQPSINNSNAAQPLKTSFREMATINVMHDISDALDKLLPDSSASVNLSHKLMEFLSLSVNSLIHASPSFPRFLFQPLQSTVVKLAISPQQGSNQEPILVRADTHLSLKVEGIVQRGDRPALFRSVHSVTIAIGTNLVNRSVPVSNVKANEVTSVQLSQTVQPHNDYFSTNFVLPFGIPGIHSAKMEVSVVDENGIQWNTGPTTTITVKSYDDSIQRQHQHIRSGQARGNPQQQQPTSSSQAAQQSSHHASSLISTHS